MINTKELHDQYFKGLIKYRFVLVRYCSLVKRQREGLEQLDKLISSNGKRAELLFKQNREERIAHLKEVTETLRSI